MAVTMLQVERRSVVADGRPFGTVGAYEKIAGVLRFEVDPEHPLHAAITDLGHAPRNARGRVEASLFNGSHPDDRHANFDLQGGRLNAVAARVTIAPSRFVVASAWGGYIPAESGAHALDLAEAQRAQAVRDRQALRVVDRRFQ